MALSSCFGQSLRCALLPFRSRYKRSLKKGAMGALNIASLPGNDATCGTLCVLVSTELAFQKRRRFKRTHQLPDPPPRSPGWRAAMVGSIRVARVGQLQHAVQAREDPTIGLRSIATIFGPFSEGEGVKRPSMFAQREEVIVLKSARKNFRCTR